MEHISRILSRSQGSGRPGPSTTWTKRVRPCDDCGREYEAHIRTVGGKEIIANLVCPECRDKRTLEEMKNKALAELKQVSGTIRLRWREECGLPKLFHTKTLTNFETNRQPKAFAVVSKYAGGSLVLSSPDIYGVGKTHLVAGLINRLVETSETARLTVNFDIALNPCPALFITENALLARIRATYGRKPGSESETEEDIYRSLERTPLLVIDDCGKVRPNDYSFLQSVYFRMLDYRYVNGKAVILTTNLGYNELEQHIGGACADRLREMCGKNGFIKMTGESYRKK